MKEMDYSPGSLTQVPPIAPLLLRVQGRIGTASGLNAVLFAPWFALTTLNCILRSVGPNTFSAENDCGEMFHNFWMHPDLRQYCAIDLTGLFPEEVKSTGRPGSGYLCEAWNWDEAVALSGRSIGAVAKATFIGWHLFAFCSWYMTRCPDMDWL